MGSTIDLRKDKPEQKLKGLQASAREIDAVANVFDSKLSKIHQLLRQSANGVNQNINYIIVGDSTRAMAQNNMLSYYTFMLEKVNVTPLLNSSSGQTLTNWFNNIGNSTYSQLMSLIPDNGDNTIIEFSFGINDFIGGITVTEFKTQVHNAINTILQSKPNVSFIFVSPIAIYDNFNIDIEQAYNELSSELNIFLVSGYNATKDVYGDSDYYYDIVHPNNFGSRRLLNYILDNILPLEAKQFVSIEELINVQSALSVNLMQGYYQLASGNFIADTAWRSIEKQSVAPNSTIQILHQGDKLYYNKYDASGGNIGYGSYSLMEGIVDIIIPSDTYFISFTISSNATTYESLNDTITLSYKDATSSLYLSINEINYNLNCKLPINKFNNGILVDDYGKTGTSGQTLTIDVNGKMKWA